MFNDLFNMFGEVPPVGEVVEEQGKHYFLIHKLKRFVAFLGVEVEGPEEIVVHGKPVVVVIYSPEVEKYQEALKENRNAKAR